MYKSVRPEPKIAHFIEMHFALEDGSSLRNWAYMMCMKETKSQHRCHLTVVLSETLFNVGR